MDAIELPIKALEDIVRRIDIIVRSIDRAIASIDARIASIDSIILTRATVVEPVTAPGTSGRSSVPSPSYPGQSPESYCLECLVRHYTKALGLLEEAERFSLAKGEITPESRQRIALALKEVVTAEEDLGTNVRDPELARMLDEINVKQRQWRKWLWTEMLLTTQKDISKLREAIARMKEIVDLTMKAAEYYDSKYGRCPFCEQLASELSEKFGVDEREAIEIIYGLASDDENRVKQSAEKLKKIGAADYVMKRVEEMRSEMKC